MKPPSAGDHSQLGNYDCVMAAVVGDCERTARPESSQTPKSSTVKNRSPATVYPKNGIALTKQVTKPAPVIGYQPANQTPRLLNRKKIQEAVKDPAGKRSLLWLRDIQPVLGVDV